MAAVAADLPRAIGAYRYLLLDQSGLPALVAHPSALNRFERRNLLTAGSEDALDGASPLLVEIGSTQDERALTRLIHVVAEQGRFACAVHALATPEPIEVACARLEARTHALMPDGTDAVLRYFDTRVLAHLHAVLTPAQWRALTGCCGAWWAVRRDGCLEALADVSYLPAEPPELPFVLSSQQEIALITAAEPDTLAGLLIDQGVAPFAEQTPPERHAFVLAAMAAARGFGLRELDEFAAYAGLALMLGMDFATRPPWAERLQQVKGGKRRFAEVLHES